MTKMLLDSLGAGWQAVSSDQHPRHLLPRLLRLRASRGQRRWRVWGWSCGVESMTINIEWQDQNGNWHHYQSKQNQADAYRVAQRRAESSKKRHRLLDDDGRLLDLLNP